MSFILDALRRADRERQSERGGVPSLYTQAAPAPTNHAPAADDAPRPWLWLAAGLSGGLILAAVWALWSATPSTTGAASSAPEPAVPPAVAAMPAASAARTPPAEATRPVAEPAAAAAPKSEAPSRAPSPAEPRREAPQAANPPAERPRPATPRVPENTARAEAKPAPARPAPEIERPTAARPDTARAPAPHSGDEPAASTERATALPIRQISELSAEVRSKLPALTIGGAMYSANASSRRLIVNGQLLSEGDAVAPGVTLEEIRLKSAVLRTKELRYELGF